MVPDPNLVLDQITDTVGSILYRGPAGWIGLDPGSSGQVLAIVDGEPVWADIAGGGGGGGPADQLSWFAPNRTAQPAMNAASIGMWFLCTASFDLTALACQMSSVNTGQYILAIAPFDPTTSKITSAPTDAATITATVTEPDHMFTAKLATPFVCIAGVTYILMIRRVDGADNIAQTMNAAAAGLPTVATFMSGTNQRKWVAKKTPATTDAWTTQGSGSFLFGFLGALA